jgi:hypothetical protein
MRPCACGKAVMLRAMRIVVNRGRYIVHWIEHADGSKGIPDEWKCSACKPYPKESSQREFAKLMRRWEGALTEGTETHGE